MSGHRRGSHSDLIHAADEEHEMFSRSRASLDSHRDDFHSPPASPTKKGSYDALTQRTEEYNPFSRSNPFGNWDESTLSQPGLEPYDPVATRAYSASPQPYELPSGYSYQPYDSQLQAQARDTSQIRQQTTEVPSFDRTVKIVIGPETPHPSNPNPSGNPFANPPGEYGRDRNESVSSSGSLLPGTRRVDSTQTLVAPAFEETWRKSVGSDTKTLTPSLIKPPARSPSHSRNTSETKPLILAEKVATEAAAKLGGDVSGKLVPGDTPVPGGPGKPGGKGGPGSKPGEPYTLFGKQYQRFILTTVTIAGFFGPLAGTIYLPALPVLKNDFKVSTTEIDVTISVFMVMFAVGPLFWSSYADWKGRRPLYLISLGIYVVANVLLTVLPANYPVLIILRILQAFGSSAVVSMGAGSVADVIEPKGRGKAMSTFLLGPQCGPIIGPLLGGLLAGQAHWRWIFGFLAASGLALWVVIFLYLPETLRSRVGNGAMYPLTPRLLLPPTFQSPKAPKEKCGPPPPKPNIKTYWRLFKYMPIGIVSFNTAILYATYFSVTVIFPIDISERYGWSVTAVGAALVPSGIALILGSMAGGRWSDYRRNKLLASRKMAALEKGEDPDEVKIEPENRLLDQIWGVLIYVAGVLMYGWFVEAEIHVVGVIFATILIGFGNSWVFVSSTAFLSEIAQRQAAVAFALGNLLRNPAAAVAAVMIYPITERVGTGWTFTALAVFNLCFVGYGILVLRMAKFEGRPGS